MTNDEVLEKVVRWVRQVTGHVTIKAHQGGPSPADPFIVANLTTTRDLQVRPFETRYRDTEALNSEGKAEVAAAAAIDTEWTISVHAYGTNPTETLRRLRAASHLAQATEPLMPELVIHEMSQIRDVPDWINNQWQARAQMDVFVRGIVIDEFVIDVIEETSFDIDRA